MVILLTVIIIFVVIVILVSVKNNNSKVAWEREMELKSLEERDLKRKLEEIQSKKLKDIEEGNLEEIEVETLLLSSGEVCYLAERVSAGKIKNKIDIREGMFYITSKRVILTTGLDSFDKSIDKVSSIQVGDDYNFSIQFGSTTYVVYIVNPIIVKKLLETLMQNIIDIKNETVKTCTYCGTSNKINSMDCKKCGGPLK